MKIIISILMLVSIIIFILCIYYAVHDTYINNYTASYQRSVLDMGFADSNVSNNLNNTPIYAINMKQSKARRNNLQKQFDKYNIKNYKFINAIDGSKITTMNNSQRKPAKNYTNKSKYVSYKVGDTLFKIREPDYASNSEVGCTLSHLKAIETAYNDNLDKVIIVEDDIDLLPIKTWRKTLDELLDTAPNDWEAIYDAFIRDTYYNKNIDFIKYSIIKPHGAWFYVINRRGMKTLLNKFKQDNYYILDAYKNKLTNGGQTGIAADLYIPYQINAYNTKMILTRPNNNKLDMDSTIHTNHTDGHIHESNNRINKIYKNSKFVPKVPKKLHLIWIGPKKPPKSLNSWTVDFKKSYPDYEVTIWNEDMIDELNLINRDIYDDVKEYAGKADIARYEIMYRFGGIYIDADTIWLGKIPEFKGLLNFLKEKNNFKDLVANTFIGGIANHPFLEQVIKELPEWYENHRDSLPWKSTGPLFITHMYKKLDPSFSDVYIIPIDKVLCPTDWHKLKDIDQLERDCRQSGAFAFHYGLLTNN